MSWARVFYGLFWIGWAGFWQVIAQELLGWSPWFTLLALLILVILYNKVVNWWPGWRSGVLSFLMFYSAGVVGTWAWSAVSPVYDYAPASALGWINLGLFWGYIGLAIGKAFLTIEARTRPYCWQPLFLQFLREGWPWEEWVDDNWDRVKRGNIPEELSARPKKKGSGWDSVG